MNDTDTQQKIQEKVQATLEAWRQEVAHNARARDIDDSLTDSVRDLICLGHDWLEEPADAVSAEVAKQGYALAHRALIDMGQRTVIALFRDALSAAMASQCAGEPEAAERLPGFFNALTDAYWQSYSDTLKRTIRNQAAENIAKELRIAKHIQQYLLPKSIPKIDGYEFAGRLLPAAEVGGDYWSVKYYERDGIVTFKLADIAGHGLGSATLVAAVKFISGGYYPGAKTASAVMQQTNHVLVKETPSDILTTMIYGWLHPDSGDISLVNAGHSPIFILHGDETIDIEPTGPVLGLAESRYTERRMHLEPGDIVFTCSDGITEARQGRVMYGVERVKEVVRASKDMHASEIIDTVISSAQAFSGGPTDDMSAVVIKVLEDGARNRWRPGVSPQPLDP